MKIKQEFAHLFVSVVDTVHAGNHLRITYDGQQWNYHVLHHYMSSASTENNSCLEAIYGEDEYEDHVASIYGYDTGGNFPEYKTIEDLRKLLYDMEQRGATISKK